MRTDEWIVGIPSRARVSQLNHKTLRTLAEAGVPSERVIVTVHRDEYAAYANGLDHALYGVLFTHEHLNDVSGAHNSLNDYVVTGNLVSLDDDVEGVYRAADQETLERVTDLPEFFSRAFRLCTGLGASLWGVYPVRNAFYMSPGRIRTGLSFCVGHMFGQILRDMPHERTVLGGKDDYERSLQHFMHDGCVVRFDDIACASKVYNGEGGLQGIRTPAEMEKHVQELERRFPGLVRRKRGRATEYPEIRLVNPRP